MSDTSRNDEVMKYCFGDDAEFVAVKHYERLQRELAEAREENKRLIADMILHERMSSQFQDERDTLAEALERIVMLGQSMPDLSYEVEIAKQALAAVKGGSHE